MKEFEDTVPFFQPDIGKDEIAEVAHSLEKGWITTGEKTKQFEKDFAAYLGGGMECIAVNSATAGLHLTLEAMGIGSGDEVIVPDYTFTASAEVVRYLGADPVFVDIDDATLNITAELIEKKITPRTKAIMVVHFAGLAANMSNIIALAKRKNLHLIEDAAHALPTTHNKEMVGALESDAAVFSFYATKTITTGEGGMIATKDPAIAARCKVMRLHGIDRDSFDRYTADKVSWQYDVVAPGYKYNMGDIAASIGIHQLKKADQFQRRRAEISRLYTKGLAGLPLILPQDAPNGDQHSWHLYVIRLSENAPIDRDQLIEELSRKGIKCSVHFIPMHRLSYWRDKYELRGQDFRVSENVFNNCISLPLFTKMSDKQVERVIESLKYLLT